MADLIETMGLDEEIRCAMCTNPRHNENGCDGACQYDERLYQKIMSVLEERITAGGDTDGYNEDDLASDMRDYCERYEPTYNPEDGSM